MYKLYTDKTEIFECDIQLTGASLKNSKARLIVETPDVNLLFKGEILKGGKCRVPVKKLKGILGETSEGKIKLEVIADDTYFNPWESEFKVESSKQITVEVKSQSSNIIKDDSPKMKVNVLGENNSTTNTPGTRGYSAYLKKGDVKKQRKSLKKSIEKTTGYKPANDEIFIEDDITMSERKHIVNIMKLLIREDINIKNLSIKRNKLNKIVAVYTKRFPINESVKPKVMEGVIKVLSKLKK